jgi:hypothetical protein
VARGAVREGGHAHLVVEVGRGGAQQIGREHDGQVAGAHLVLLLHTRPRTFNGMERPSKEEGSIVSIGHTHNDTQDRGGEGRYRDEGHFVEELGEEQEEPQVVGRQPPARRNLMSQRAPPSRAIGQGGCSLWRRRWWGGG